MNCRNVERLLSKYLDNSLDMSERQKLEMHLDVCTKCADNLKSMMKVDNLLKLKLKEKPTKEYFENYWTKLKSRLTEYPTENRTMVPRRFNDGRWSNLFTPRFSSAFSGILIVLLILVNGLLYVQIRQVTSLQTVLAERQEEMQKEISRYLTKTHNKVIIPKS